MKRLLALFAFTLPFACVADLPYLDIASDVQRPDQEFNIKRVFSGNTPMIRWTVTDGAMNRPADLSSWTFTLWYGRDNSATQGVAVSQLNKTNEVSGITTNARVRFLSLTNFFAIPNDNYYVAIVGTHTSGAVRTWATGKMNQKWDFAANSPAGAPSQTTPLNWNLFGPYSGTPPIYAGANMSIVNSTSGTTISASSGTATNGINSVVNTTNPAGVASLTANVLYIGTNSLSLDTNAVITLINSSTNTAARLASNVWAAADSTTNYALRSVTPTGAGVTGIVNTLSVLRSGGTYISTADDWQFNSPDGQTFISVGNAGALIGNTAATLSVGLLNPGVIEPANGSFAGDGSGLTGINGASITNLFAFSIVRTNGGGNVVTNLTFGGSVITQQMGTVSGGGSTSTLYRVESQVNGIGFTTANGPTAVLTGAVTAVSAAPWVDTWEVANTITTQTIAQSVWSNINFDTYAPDNSGRNYNITNDVLTFSSTGLCHVTAAARVSSMSANQRVQMSLFRNGIFFRQGIVLTATTNATPTLSVSFYNHAATNQYTVAVQQDDATPRTLTGGGTASGYFIWASGYRFRNAGE